jgi:hypothetical protein
MLRLFCVALLTVMAVHAQFLIDPVKGAQAWHSLEPVSGEKAMTCRVIPIRPAISFSFRLQAGYVVNVPIREYAGKPHVWAVMVKITPEQGDPVYLGTNLSVPKLPDNKRDELSFSGVFLLGEGRYDVELAAVDDSNRICRKAWTLQAKATRDEQKMRSMLPPNRVEPLTFHAPRKRDGDSNLRITILLHAAPSFPRSTQLRGRDRSRLLGSLASLLEQLPAATVKLVAFNLDQQREIYRTDNFDDNAFRKLSDSLAQIDLGVVDVRTLGNRTGHIDLLANLIEAEANSDAVIFFGPVAHNGGRVTAERSSDAPKYFYFQFRPMRERPGPADVIESATKRVGGKVIPIHTPQDLAKAIAEVEKYLVQKR